MTRCDLLLTAGVAEHRSVPVPAAAGAGRLQRSHDRRLGAAEWAGGLAAPGPAALPQGGGPGHDCAALPHLPHPPRTHWLLQGAFPPVLPLDFTVIGLPYRDSLVSLKIARQ